MKRWYSESDIAKMIIICKKYDSAYASESE